MNDSKKRFVILCHEAFNYIKNKTGNMLIRYRPEEVLAVIDKEKVGSNCEKEVGVGGDTPVLSDFNARTTSGTIEGRAYAATPLLVLALSCRPMKTYPSSFGN